MAEWSSGDNECCSAPSLICERHNFRKHKNSNRVWNNRVCQITLILVITTYLIGEWHSLLIIQLGPAKAQEWATCVTKKIKKHSWRKFLRNCFWQPISIAERFFWKKWRQDSLLWLFLTFIHCNVFANACIVSMYLIHSSLVDYLAQVINEKKCGAQK